MTTVLTGEGEEGRAGEGADFGRAFHGGRDAAGSLGQRKEFSAQGQKEFASPPDGPGNPTVDFHGEKRTNQTHESKIDPDALLARKGAGKQAKLSYSGNLLVENRNGLIVQSTVWEATGTAERLAALATLEQVPGRGRVTVGGGGYFTLQPCALTMAFHPVVSNFFAGCAEVCGDTDAVVLVGTVTDCSVVVTVGELMALEEPSTVRLFSGRNAAKVNRITVTAAGA